MELIISYNLELHSEFLKLVFVFKVKISSAKSLVPIFANRCAANHCAFSKSNESLQRLHRLQILINEIVNILFSMTLNRSSSDLGVLSRRNASIPDIKSKRLTCTSDIYFDRHFARISHKCE